MIRIRSQRSLILLAVAASIALPLGAQAAQPDDVLTNAAALAAINSAEKSANETGAKVCIAVVDAGGNLKAFKRMDGAAPGCVASSINKARAAAMYQIPTLGFMDRVNHGEPALTTLPGMVPLGGGVPAKVGDTFIGAVGAAGTKNPDEVKIATAGATEISHK